MRRGKSKEKRRGEVEGKYEGREEKQRRVENEWVCVSDMRDEGTEGRG